MLQKSRSCAHIPPTVARSSKRRVVKLPRTWACTQGSGSPSPSGRLTVDDSRRRDLPLRAAQKVCHSLDVNCGPRSDTTSLGIPWRRNTCCTSSSPVSAAVGTFRRGTKCANLAVNYSHDYCVSLPRIPSQGHTIRRSAVREQPRLSYPRCAPPTWTAGLDLDEITQVRWWTVPWEDSLSFLRPWKRGGAWRWALSAAPPLCCSCGWNDGRSWRILRIARAASWWSGPATQSPPEF